jgi:hypothetical protein
MKRTHFYKYSAPVARALEAGDARGKTIAFPLFAGEPINPIADFFPV